MSGAVGDEGPVVLFDGACGLCAAGVRQILRHERVEPGRPPIRFVAIQAPEGARLAARHGVDVLDPDTFLLMEDGRALARSDAALAVAAHLGGPARLARVAHWLPRPLRDAAYGLVARHRHRLFGRRDACLAPTPEQRGRFVLPEGRERP